MHVLDEDATILSQDLLLPDKDIVDYPHWFFEVQPQLSLDIYDCLSSPLHTIFVGTTGLVVYMKDTEMHFGPNGTHEPDTAKEFKLEVLHSKMFVAGLVELAMWFKNTGFEQYPQLREISISPTDNLVNLIKRYFGELNPKIFLQQHNLDYFGHTKYSLDLQLLSKTLSSLEKSVPVLRMHQYIGTQIANGTIFRVLNPRFVFSFIRSYVSVSIEET